MSNLKKKIKDGGIVAVVIIVMLALLYSVSWIITCGIIKLITVCFGLVFSWKISTGIWLVLCLVSVTVKSK